MDTYTYSYRVDSKQEPIGRVKATSLQEARAQICVKKDLNELDIDAIFVIKKEENGHDSKVRQYHNK